jgi:hypothetical protein
VDVQRVLRQMEDDKMTDETDSQASLFWLGSPSNRVDGNVAVGGVFGIWLELRRKVRPSNFQAKRLRHICASMMCHVAKTHTMHADLDTLNSSSYTAVPL